MVLKHFIRSALVIPLLIFFALTEASNNLTLPASFSNHGDPNLLCRPAKWTDIAVFYLGNYAAHAATTKSIPGQTILTSVLVVVSALLFPVSGLHRGLQAICSLAVFAKTDLQMAARAGALCMVVVEEPDPKNIDEPATNTNMQDRDTHELSEFSSAGVATQRLMDEEQGLSRRY
jgi:hypothetical protein